MRLQRLGVRRLLSHKQRADRAIALPRFQALGRFPRGELITVTSEGSGLALPLWSTILPCEATPPHLADQPTSEAAGRSAPRPLSTLQRKQAPWGSARAQSSNHRASLLSCAHGGSGLRHWLHRIAATPISFSQHWNNRAKPAVIRSLERIPPILTTHRKQLIQVCRIGFSVGLLAAKKLPIKIKDFFRSSASNSCQPTRPSFVPARRVGVGDSAKLALARIATAETGPNFASWAEDTPPRRLILWKSHRCHDRDVPSLRPTWALVAAPSAPATSICLQK